MNLSFACDAISDSEATGATRGANWQNLFHQLSGWVRKGTIVVELLIKLGDRFFFLVALLSVNYGIVCGRKASAHDTGRKTSRPRNALRSPRARFLASGRVGIFERFSGFGLSLPGSDRSIFDSRLAALGCSVPNANSLSKQ